MRGPIDRISKFINEIEGRLLPGTVIIAGCDDAECSAEIAARRARGELRDVAEVVSSKTTWRIIGVVCLIVGWSGSGGCACASPWKHRPPF
jgi:hypothetical protein